MMSRGHARVSLGCDRGRYSVGQVYLELEQRHQQQRVWDLRAGLSVCE
jgi:hypothetical protein